MALPVMLFEQNLGWASAIARNVARQLPPSFDPQDLEQEAHLELWKAAAAFDPARGVPFQGYAYLRVRGAVLMACRRRSWTAGTTEEIDPAAVDPHENPSEQLLSKHAQKLKDATGRKRRKIIMKAMPGLSVSDAYLLKRIYFDEIGTEELAESWRMPRAMLARRVALAVRRLKARTLDAT